MGAGIGVRSGSGSGRGPCQRWREEGLGRGWAGMVKRQRSAEGLAYGAQLLLWVYLRDGGCIVVFVVV
jgi:hypothetical protein